MQDAALEPWMLRADWREDRRPFVILDLSTWPAETLVDPLPPVPLLAVGHAAHPRAADADLIVEPPLSLTGLAHAIRLAPVASAVLVQLLRTIQDLPPDRALTAESLAFAALQAGTEHRAWLASRSTIAPSEPGTLHILRTGGRLDVVIDRPAARNAIDRAMRDSLYEAFSLAAFDDGIERVRLRGRGRAFSVGADLAEFGGMSDPSEAHAIRSRTLPAHVMARRAGIYEVHVQGACVGAGLELAAFAGRLTASPGAWFQLPETGMGVLPGFGGCVSIPRRIGRQRACALMLSGRRIGVQTALRWGLIDAIVDEPAVDERGADIVG